MVLPLGSDVAIARGVLQAQAYRHIDATLQAGDDGLPIDSDDNDQAGYGQSFTGSLLDTILH